MSKRSAGWATVLVLLCAGCAGTIKTGGEKLPYTPSKPEPLPQVLMKTTMGDLKIELFEDSCPNTVANFVDLVEKKFYDGLAFHRIIKDFCVQGGDPEGTGAGGPGYMLPPEFYDGYKKNEYGTLAMAKPGNTTDQSGSQFYFNVKKAPGGNRDLDGKHVVFGKVIDGLDVLEKMANVQVVGSSPQEPVKMLSVTMIRKRDHPYECKQRIAQPVEAVVPIPAGEKTAQPAKTDAPAKTEKTGDAAPEAKTETAPEAKSAEAEKTAKTE